jgi:hypothetical protein
VWTAGQNVFSLYISGEIWYYITTKIKQGGENVKKTLSILCFCLLLLSLVGCDPAVYTISKGSLSNIVKIELYNYENNAPEIIDVDGEKKPKFDFNKATLIATLDESRFDEILNEISSFHYTNYGNALNEPMGKTLVLHRSNGNFIVLFGCIYTNENGNTFYYGDCYEFHKDGSFYTHTGDVGYLFSDRIEAKYFKTDSGTAD